MYIKQQHFIGRAEHTLNMKHLYNIKADCSAQYSTCSPNLPQRNSCYFSFFTVHEESYTLCFGQFYRLECELTVVSILTPPPQILKGSEFSPHIMSVLQHYFRNKSY
jgi:hypothetical protein